MSDETDTAAHSSDEPPEEQGSGTEQSRFDRRLLSDLSVNVVPIVIIGAFVLMFGLVSPGSGDPLFVFHGALVGGIVLVSAVAGWVISREDSELEGSVASGRDTESDHD